MATHYVYQLWSMRRPRVLLYVGRSLDPVARKKAHEAKRGVLTHQIIVGVFPKFEDAAEAEKSMITALRPPWNQVVHSGRGMLGKTMPATARQRISQAHKGKTVSAEARQRMSDAHKTSEASLRACREAAAARVGKPLSAEHRSKIGQGLLGGKRSDATRAKMREAWVRRKQEGR